MRGEYAGKCDCFAHDAKPSLMLIVKHFTSLIKRNPHSKVKQNIMHRSKEYGHMHLQSSANASWGNPRSPCRASNEMFASSTKPSICVDRLLLHLRRDRRQLLDQSHKREKHPTPPKRALVDENKMDQLLQLLRTNEFVGTIDPKHHSYHLSEEHALMTRQSFAHVSTKRESSHFKAALKKAKSTSAVASQR
jgi:hypothetical protein